MTGIHKLKNGKINMKKIILLITIGLCLSASAATNNKSEDIGFWEKDHANRGNDPLMCYQEYRDCLDDPTTTLPYCRIHLYLCLPKQR